VDSVFGIYTGEIPQMLLLGITGMISSILYTTAQLTWTGQNTWTAAYKC